MDEAPRGLATLALLKTRFDEGRDHLGLLEPFVADAVVHWPTDSFVPSDIAEAVGTRSGLRLPADTVRTVLGRLTRKGKLRKDGGRFFAVDIRDPSLDSARAAVDLQHAALAERLARYADAHGVTLPSLDAISVLAQFITDNKVPLLLQQPLPDSPLERSTLDKKLTRVVARFIAEECFVSEEMSTALQTLTEGMVLQDAVLLRDIADLPRRFRNLTVVLDTPILFASLDLTGVANGLATREFLTLLREAGAITIAFDRTVDEMKRILAVYEAKLATAQGRISLHPTPLTHHFLTSHATPSEVRTISVTLERRLAQLSIGVRKLPDRDRRFTLDEAALAEGLRDRDGVADAPRIRHDIDCVASVLTLRRGRTATAIETSSAVFCTTSGRVIRNTQAWYRGQGEHGVPPVVHQYALSSIAWLKRPQASGGVKLHELAALCAAALRPSRETWNKFILNLEHLRTDGAISDAEAVALIANELTEPLLASLDEEGEPDADTIQDAIDRVRREYRTEAEAVSRAAIQEARGETALAQQAAASATARFEAVRSGSHRRAHGIAHAFSAVAFWGLTAVVVAAGLLSIPGVDAVIGGRGVLIARGIAAVGIVLGIYSQVYGPSVSDLRSRLEGRVYGRAMAMLFDATIAEPVRADDASQVKAGDTSASSSLTV